LPLVAADGAPPTVVASAPVADASPGIPPGYDVPGGTGPQSWPADAGRPVAPVGSAPAAAALPPGPGGAGGLFSLPSEGIGAGRAGGPGRPGGPGGAVENGPRTQGGAESRGRGGVAGPTGTERGGAVGGAAPGTRRGKNTDDEERKTKYLEDEDLGTQWGTTGFVAPPVIGDKR
jgi:translation initiation factor IF-2